MTDTAHGAAWSELAKKLTDDSALHLETTLTMWRERGGPPKLRVKICLAVPWTASWMPIDNAHGLPWGWYDDGALCCFMQTPIRVVRFGYFDGRTNYRHTAEPR